MARANLQWPEQICSDASKSAVARANLQWPEQICNGTSKSGVGRAHLRAGHSSCKKIRRLDDLANIEGAGRGKRRETDPRIGFQLFFKKSLQYRFGIDVNEFLSQNTIEGV